MGKFDAGSAALGGASGAATGFGIGGPAGAAVGAVAGGLLGAFGRSKQKRKKAKKLSTLDATQQGIYGDYAKALQGKGGQFGDLFNFDANQAKDVFSKMYAQPAYQNFKENIVPGITGNFRSGNIQNSSYLGGALSKAGTDVQRNLDAQMADMLYQGQKDSVERRIKGINDLLNMQTFAYQQPDQPQQSGGDQAFNALVDVGGKAAGSYIDKKLNGGV